ncbi:MAG: hypothetical protein WA435_13500 [Gallionellaceae bacterium]
MKKFSERIGVIEVVPMLQTDGMNEALRNSIWNLLIALFQNDWQSIAAWMAESFLKVPVDEIPHYEVRCREWAKNHFYKLSWNAVYDLVESITNVYEDLKPYSEHSNETVASFFNQVFEREMSGYRFINGALAPISNPAETMEISGAIEKTSRTGLDGAHHHIQTALSLLAKKPDPD